MADKFVTQWPAQMGIPQSTPVAVSKLAGVLAWHAGDDPKRIKALEAWYEMVARAIVEDTVLERNPDEMWLALENSLAWALGDGLSHGNWPWEK